MAPTYNPIPAGFPPPTLATAFVDGVVNFSPSPEVVRFYLMRWDGNFDAAKNDFATQVLGQIIMPNHGFLTTVMFFEQAINYMVKLGHFTPDQVEKARAAATSTPLPSAD